VRRQVPCHCRSPHRCHHQLRRQHWCQVPRPLRRQGSLWRPEPSPLCFRRRLRHGLRQAGCCRAPQEGYVHALTALLFCSSPRFPSPLSSFFSCSSSLAASSALSPCALRGPLPTRPSSHSLFFLFVRSCFRFAHYSYPRHRHPPAQGLAPSRWLLHHVRGYVHGPVPHSRPRRKALARLLSRTHSTPKSQNMALSHLLEAAAHAMLSANATLNFSRRQPLFLRAALDKLDDIVLCENNSSCFNPCYVPLSCFLLLNSVSHPSLQPFFASLCSCPL